MIPPASERTAAGQGPSWAARCPSSRFFWPAVWVGFAILAWYSLFLLPYHFPPQQLVASDSVNMGFNNRVATLAALGLVALAIVLSALSGRGHGDLLSALPEIHLELDRPERVSLSRRSLLLVLSLYVGAALFLYSTLPHLEEYGEAGYFLHRISLILQYHLVPYKDIEFGYGPALIYLPVWFSRLGQVVGLSLPTCYIVCYSLLSAIGVWLLYFVVNSLEVPLRHRRQMFFLLSLFLFNISMGMQYLLIRFLLPYALYIALHETLPAWVESGPFYFRAKAWFMSFLASLLALSVSPEVGLVFIVCQSAGCLFRMQRAGIAYLPCCIATLTALPATLLLLSSNYLATVFMFARGGANFPLVPSPFVLLFMILVFFTIPLGIHEIRKSPLDSRSPLLLVLCLHPLLAMPAALGRSDAGHILLNGLGVFILSFALMTCRSALPRRSFSLVMILIFGVAAQFSSFWLYEDYLRPVVDTLSGRPHTQEIRSDLVEDLRIKPMTRIATPLGSDRSTENALRNSGLYFPQYFPDSFNIATEAQVSRQIADLEGVTILLIPIEYLQFRTPQEIDGLWLTPGFRKQIETQKQLVMQKALLYPVDFKIIHKPYLPDLELAKYILSHYRPLRASQGYALMVRKREGQFIN